MPESFRFVGSLSNVAFHASKSMMGCPRNDVLGG